MTTTEVERYLADLRRQPPTSVIPTPQHTLYQGCPRCGQVARTVFTERLTMKKTYTCITCRHQWTEEKP